MSERLAHPAPPIASRSLDSSRSRCSGRRKVTIMGMMAAGIFFSRSTLSFASPNSPRWA